MMINKLKLRVPENGYGYPCNLCENNTKPVSYCRDCAGYNGPFVVELSDLRALMEARAQDAVREEP